MQALKIEPRETVVAKCSCGGCGRNVPAKVNKNGNVYYFCTDEERGGCGHHEKWAKTRSIHITDRYLTTGRPYVMPAGPFMPAGDVRTAANTNAAPRPPVEAAPAKRGEYSEYGF